MPMYLSPLVDVKEIDLSTTIPAVATSIGIIILRDTWKGPELKVQLINSIDELIERFGRPEEADANSYYSQSYEDLLAATGFLQFGTNLYCTRVLAPSATFAGVYGTVTAPIALSSSSSSSSSSSESSSSSLSSSSTSSTSTSDTWYEATIEPYWGDPEDGEWNGTIWIETEELPPS